MPDHEISAAKLRTFLWESIQALLPTLAFDIAGTMALYYLLVHFYGGTSIWPVLGASLVPVISNVYNFVRRHSLDIVGLIVLVGLIVGVIPALFGGSQRLLLVRESFVTGLIGVVLIVSALIRKPLGFIIVKEFLTANEALPDERFEVLWRSRPFRRGIRRMTIGWGALLVGEFVLRAYMALKMNVAFVLGAAPLLFTLLLLLAGLYSAFWLARAIRHALSAESA